MTTFEPMLQVKRLHPQARIPVRAMPGDCGLDLFVDEDTWIQPGQFVDVPAGIAVRLPDGYWGMIVGRSSTLRRRGLMVAHGIIDTGYTGPLFVGVSNLGGEGVLATRGERLAQMILLPNVVASLGFGIRETEHLGFTYRATDGFGSTGQ